MRGTGYEVYHEGNLDNAEVVGLINDAAPTWTAQHRFDAGVHIDTGTSSNPLYLSRSGSTDNQVMSIGLTDTEVNFLYIEDTSSEGNGNFGKYRFNLGGNDGESSIVAMQIDKDHLYYGGQQYFENSTDTVVDARISESSVTQHEAALAIATSQLTGTIGTAQIADGNVTPDKLNLNIAASGREHRRHLQRRVLGSAPHDRER